MAYSVNNKCSKNCWKQTVLVQLVIEDMVTCFFKTFSNQQSRETVVGTSASITVSSVTTLNSTF